MACPVCGAPIARYETQAHINSRRHQEAMSNCDDDGEDSQQFESDGEDFSDAASEDSQEDFTDSEYDN